MATWKKCLYETHDGLRTGYSLRLENGSELIGQTIEATRYDRIGHPDCFRGMVREILNENIADPRVDSLRDNNHK